MGRRSRAPAHSWRYDRSRARRPRSATLSSSTGRSTTSCVVSRAARRRCRRGRRDGTELDGLRGRRRDERIDRALRRDQHRRGAVASRRAIASRSSRRLRASRIDLQVSDPRQKLEKRDARIVVVIVGTNSGTSAGRRARARRQEGIEIDVVEVRASSSGITPPSPRRVRSGSTRASMRTRTSPGNGSGSGCGGSRSARAIATSVTTARSDIGSSGADTSIALGRAPTGQPRPS